MNEKENQTKQADHVPSFGRCRVCTKQIHSGEDYLKVFHGGGSYLVCCASCAAKFEANPQLYLVP